MRLHLKKKSIARLTKDEYDACYLLNLGWAGQMRTDITTYRTNKTPGAKAIMLEHDGELVAWALFGPDNFGEFEGSIAQFFVKESMRGRGLGKILMQQVLKLDKNPFVWPDENNSYFFKKYRNFVRCEDAALQWLKD